MISKKFITASVLMATVSSLYLIISNLLDKYIDPVISDIIGKVITAILAFIIHSKVFINKTDINKSGNYLIADFSATILAVFLFYLYIHYFKIPKINNTIARMIISSTVYVFYLYPLTKYWVFKK